MKTLILFGGGDAGGILITPGGIRPIPPFGPDLRLSLKSTSSLVNAIEASSSDHMKTKMAKTAISLCNLAIEMAEEVVGPLDEDRSIIFQDDDGGFTCGSTGKPPVPIPWPPSPITSVNEIISSGVIDSDLVALVQGVKAGQMSFIEMFEHPDKIAKKLNITISEKSVRDLQLVAPSRISEIKDKVDQEVIRFFHKVLEDGRFAENWFEKPYDVAGQLKLKVSDEAIERILGAGASSAFANINMKKISTAIKAGVIWAGVCIAIGIIFGGQMNPIDEYVKDRSGADKF